MNTKNKKKIFLGIPILVVAVVLVTISGCENLFTNPGGSFSGQNDGGSGGASGELVAVADSFTVIVGRSATLPAANLTANDQDSSDSPPLTIDWVGEEVGGTATLEGANVVFDCSVSEGEAASFQYRVQNQIGLQAIGTVTLTVEAVPPIVAEADTYDLVQGEQLLVLASALLANDEDGEGRPLSIVSVGNAVGGSVSMLGENITFTSEGYAYQPAGFEYTVQNNLGTIATGSVYINVQPLPSIEAYIYHNAGLLAEKLASYQPPTMTDVFNTWGRFDGNNFFLNKDDPNINYNASAWQFLNDPDRVSMPLNVTPYNGFVSPEKLENYTFEATLSSPDGDDDTIGVVISFVRENNTNYSLVAVRNQGGTYPSTGWGVCYVEGSDYSYTGATWLIDSKSVGGTSYGSYGWSGEQSAVKVVRNGDLIKCYATDWNDTDTYQAASEIVIDLDSDPRLAKFKGPQSYGYMTYSQPYSTYLGIQIGGGLDVTKIYDAASGEVWEYVQGSGWTLLATTVWEELGFVREVINPETGDTYLIKEDEIILQ
jgi:hypothetical protein